MRQLRCQGNVRRRLRTSLRREDTGKASGTRESQQVQEPRANARRLIKSSARLIHHAGAVPALNIDVSSSVDAALHSDSHLSSLRQSSAS